MVACPRCGMMVHDGPCPALSSGRAVLQGRYELIGLLGQGGMGTVYMARDLRLHNRPCVVKKLRDDFYREEDKRKAVSFFEREADVLSRLQHPNIVHILDYFEENSDYFLIMEYVEGRDLFNVLQERGEPFTEEQVLNWAAQICDVLEYLHGYEPPVIYRDLKPSNIMIDIKGRVKLVDFGIARPFEEGGDNTHVVSAGYSPPEQYWGAADIRSDIYALGATMFFLLIGKEPLALHPCSPASESPEISSKTDATVRRATAQDPDLRYQSARQMREALEPEKEAPVAAPSRNRLGEILVGSGVIALAGLAFFGYQKLDELLRAKQEQITAKEEFITRQAKEKDQLSKKLQAYSKAAEAQDQAILEWRDQAGSRLASKAGKGSSHADVAALAAGESQLTDPEGLIPIEAQSQNSGWSIPLWGSK